MVRRKSLKVQEMESRLAEAVLGVQNGKYKSSYEAAKELGLSKDTVPRFIKRHPHLTVVIGYRIESDYGIEKKDEYNMDESGHSIGTMESIRIIIDSTLRTKHQAHPDRQEWISIIECICTDRSILPPLGIFKSKNVLQNWIPKEVLGSWFFSANTKGWTSNLHGLEWLKRVFEPVTRTKADGKYRLLIYNGYDSHISGSFIAHCLQNRIILLILPPHTSHLFQPLDVAVFGPLKKRLTTALSDLNQAQLVRIQKIEWMEVYIKARADVYHHQNIESAWRGARLHPFNPQRVFHTLGREFTPKVEISKEPIQFDIFNQVFVNSSPLDVAILQTANNLLNSTIENDTTLSTPVRQYIRKLMIGSEQLRAQSIVHQYDANNLRAIMKKCTICKKGKRLVLKGHFYISIQELYDVVIEAEKATKVQTMKKGKGKGKVIEYKTETEEDIGEEVEDESESDIGDCIIVDC
ncbi:hypothetical protein SS1G_02829 [Sclerotinia sclerotiorum 1980 UF-70]|uniref:DDE-1 domain-containing protein n=2 Tax=Sclerotinia sclerotiorum (strain ATCC 18683 / 1980 / Ss-1) TaxID=665079 RepID=A7EBZ2_SCLS1|nr:hypothetical protein SS1G_02829 [Sclerotinia sclerotiorum 1980 UF-70]APA08975.1 hypothetical protein sscle_04g037450 [Sclerotinia sclerotiorum 1980 UF-70]EDN99970.1 hypothetical protein SS1G_02829 [Sclerotinia sclerotiorum 1980 UF-70]